MRRGRRTLILTVALNLGAVVSLFGLAQLIPFPFPSLVAVYPELGYGLIAVATLGIGWSVIYTAMRLQARRSETTLSPRRPREWLTVAGPRHQSGEPRLRNRMDDIARAYEEIIERFAAWAAGEEAIRAR